MTVSWKTKAACRGRGDVAWDRFGPEQVMICLSCPVRPECLHAGITDGDSAGTWGMTSEAQRRRISDGKAKLLDVWDENVRCAEQYLVDAAAGPTPTWSLR